MKYITPLLIAALFTISVYNTYATRQTQKNINVLGTNASIILKCALANNVKGCPEILQEFMK